MDTGIQRARWIERVWGYREHRGCSHGSRHGDTANTEDTAITDMMERVWGYREDRGSSEHGVQRIRRMQQARRKYIYSRRCDTANTEDTTLTEDTCAVSTDNTASTVNIASRWRHLVRRIQRARRITNTGFTQQGSHQ